MPRIQQLSTSVINKIAAGEVIERPASIVKELLENSIDALATRIEVDIYAGGSELIRIVDDGEGIHPDDLPLAVASHATSKIRSADDLFEVNTMGFRGEALASIAEISLFRLRSRQPDSDIGHELEVRFGDQQPISACGAPVGTQIEIREIFGNTPVRRKFMKSPATEFGYISEQFSRIALANPRLHMVLRHNDRLVYELPSTTKLVDRLRLFFGPEVAEQLIRVESDVNGVRMWGYAGHPSLSKSTRKMQHMFLNGRWIQDRSLQHAFTEAYRGLVMVGRHPVCFLFLEVPPDTVDVNVHPTKIEVRFQDSQSLYRQMLAMLRNQFLSMDLDSRLRVPAGGSAPAVSREEQTDLQKEFASWATSQLEAAAAPTPVRSATIDSGSNRFVDPVAEQPWYPEPSRLSEPVAAPVNGSHADEFDDEEVATPPPTMASSARSIPPASFPAASGVTPSAPPAAPLRALQIHDCYLVIETDDGMTVIDQHALHERILYEQFRKRVLNGAVESQRLLMPIPIELSVREATLLVEHQEVLAQLGFEVEEFGKGTVLLAAYPAMLAKANREQLIRDVAEELESRAATLNRRDILDEMLHMMSCKAAVKAGQKLSDDEIDALLQQRHLCDDAHHCPHGRPTALNLTRAELDRQFGRLG